jgi:hypothetical protein
MDGMEILIPLVLFLSTAAVLVTHISAKHRERMRIIEKGMAGEDIKAMYARNWKFEPMGSLKWGILFVLAGLAIMLGNFLHDYYFVDEGVIIGMVCLFVGIGLVVFYTIASKKVTQE